MGLTVYEEDLQHVVTYIPEAGQDRTILITGASGQIGKVLADACLFYNRCHRDRIFVYAMARDMEKLKGRFAERDSYLELVAQDVVQPVQLERECDYVIHMASAADPKSYARYPVETIMTNVNGAAQVLEYARKNKRCRNVAVASTMEVYGEGYGGSGRDDAAGKCDAARICGMAEEYGMAGEDGMTGKYDSVKMRGMAREYAANGEYGMKEGSYGVIDFNDIRSGYPESKRVAELLCRSYLEEYGVASSIVRLGYIYGPTMLQDDSKAAAQFIRDIWKGRPITLKSAGGQKRTWCYAADAAAAVFHVLFHGVAGEAYNAANDQEILSIREIAELAAELSGCGIRMEAPAEEEKKGYSRLGQSILNADKLRVLGWRPRYKFREGLERTVKIIKDGGWYG